MPPPPVAGGPVTAGVCVAVTVAVGTVGAVRTVGVTLTVGVALGVTLGLIVPVGLTVVGITVAGITVAGAEPLAEGRKVVADADGGDDDVQLASAAHPRTMPTAVSGPRSTVPLLGVRTFVRYPIGQL